ncbi:MAG: hypothetical protein IKE43_04015 [Coriobacteriales bacterium]|nr:hypothetical protein [Coriobacteriales bacterium]
MKRHKLLSLVMSLSLTLALLVGVTPAAFAARAVMGDDPLAISQATDDYCPATKGAHSWIDREVLLEEATCTEEAVYRVHCLRCGYTTTLTTPALGHDWGEWDVIQEATCTEAGILTRECLRCGEEETAYLPALDHDFVVTEVIQEATCTEAGIQRCTCSRCGDTLDEVIPLAPHAFGEWYILTPATDWSSGTQEHTCTVCGTTEQAVYYLEGTLLPQDQEDAVTAFQVLLNQNGFDCGEADGSFGPNTQAATEAAEKASGHPSTGIGWTGLQAWLAGGAQTSAFDDYGWTIPSDEIQPLESASDLFSLLRSDPPRTHGGNGLVVVLQPLGGKISYDNPDSFLTLTTEVEGGVVPYTFEWRRETNRHSAKYEYLDDLLGSISLDAFTHQHFEKASSVKSEMQTAIAHAGLGSELAQEDLYSQVSWARIQMGSAVAKTESNDEGSSDYTAKTAGSYFCVITDSEGNWVATDTVLVEYNLYIYLQPSNTVIRDNSHAELSCAASGGSGNYLYEWYKVDGDVVDSTSETTTDKIEETGRYYCVVSCGVESVTSNTVTVYDAMPLKVSHTQEFYYITPGEDTADITMHIEGGIPPYTITWATDEAGELRILEEYTETEPVTYSNPSRVGYAAGRVAYTVSYPAEEARTYWLMVTDDSYNTQTDCSRVLDRTKQLKIEKQPEAEEDYYTKYLSIVMAEGTGWMDYYLYRDGELSYYIRKEAYSDDRLECSVYMNLAGEYYFHVEDSTGRWADSITVTVPWARTDYLRHPDPEAPIQIGWQPEGGDLSKRESGYITLSISVYNVFGWVKYTLYKDGRVYGSADLREKGGEAFLDITFCQKYAYEPGEYFFRVEDSTGRWIDSKKVTVTDSGTDVFSISIKASGNYRAGLDPYPDSGIEFYDIYGNSSSEVFSYDYYVKDLLTLEAVPKNGTGSISYEWTHDEFLGDYRFINETTRSMRSATIQVCRTGRYTCTAKDANGNIAKQSVKVYYYGTMPIIVQQPISVYENDSTLHVTCYAICEQTLEYKWEVKDPLLGEWVCAGYGETVRAWSSFRYRCVITNTVTGESLTSNEAHPYALQVVSWEQTLQSDKEHYRISLEFKGGGGPYVVQLCCIDTGARKHVETAYIDYFSEPGEIAHFRRWDLYCPDEELQSMGEYCDYYCIISDMHGNFCITRQIYY